ncbi:hypothetical protein Y032_0174g475 [Ancylostoma ceylanicum]|nr:hypothetical protein Y032_0174g475 [Ancylostoma ceylanicum]
MSDVSTCANSILVLRSKWYIISANCIFPGKYCTEFQKIPDAERHQQLADVAAMMRSSAELRALTEIVQRDAMRTFAAGDVPMDTI